MSRYFRWTWKDLQRVILQHKLMRTMSVQPIMIQHMMPASRINQCGLTELRCIHLRSLCSAENCMHGLLVTLDPESPGVGLHVYGIRPIIHETFFQPPMLGVYPMECASLQRQLFCNDSTAFHVWNKLTSFCCWEAAATVWESSTEAGAS